MSRQNVHGMLHGADSFCGSYAYLAPEMLAKQGHGKCVDWYLVGVVLYELVTGMPPFYDDDKAKLFKNIKNNPLEFPAHVNLSRECEDFIQKLLIKDHFKRLGSKHGASELKSHPFFMGVDWGKI